MSEPSIADLAKSIDLLVKRFEKADVSDCPFTDEEIEQIKRGAQIVEWFDTLGWIGKRFLALTGAVVLLISQWERIVQFIGGPK